MIQPFFVFGDIGIAILRIVLGIIMVVHGWSKVKNIKGTAEWMGQTFKPGIFWAIVVSLTEFVGGIFLITGFLVQIVTVLIAIQFAVITFKFNWKKGFVNGYEYDLLILVAALALTVLGGGAFSLDKFLGLLLY
ncbi:MAG: DoxX family protein [Minisyncoccia bacterium]